jgi:hypothetical protein
MATLTAEQEARRELGQHSAQCPTCRVEWRGNTPVQQQCPAADALYEQWRRTRRTGATA